MSITKVISNIMAIAAMASSSYERQGTSFLLGLTDFDRDCMVDCLAATYSSFKLFFSWHVRREQQIFL